MCVSCTKLIHFKPITVTLHQHPHPQESRGNTHVSQNMFSETGTDLDGFQGHRTGRTKLLGDFSDVEISNGFHDPTQFNESVSNSGGTRSVENLDL